ncbi:GNAT family N-acetyltransferase [Massilia jejuensis]|uniref:GNAT family N-acetyltransferase n=1 Tax=Massilia jejuensis TaxID=648894 RepID=A0ABW0PMT7_9BURK
MIVLQTERLRLRHMTDDDAAFMLALLNDPAYHRFIGDRGVRTVEAARDYMRNGAMAMVARLGFGFYIVERKEDGRPIGVSGLAKRDFLDDVDIGYAFLPEYGRQGYAIEAAVGVLAHARALGLKRLVASVRPDNSASIRVLEKLGLRFERSFQAPQTACELHLFAMEIA